MIMMRNKEKIFESGLNNIEKYFDGSTLREHADISTFYNCLSLVYGLQEDRVILAKGTSILTKQIKLHHDDPAWLLQAEALLYKWFVA